MTHRNDGMDARDAVLLILPGAVGIGLGVLVGTLVSGSPLVVGVLALAGAVAGHAAGYLLLRERGDRFA